jgi:hypothetical protein
MSKNFKECEEECIEKHNEEKNKKKEKNEASILSWNSCLK